MTYKNNNWLNYLLVFALMLLPLQNGMAAMNSFAKAPVEVKKVCHEMAQQSHSENSDMQKHTGTCCDKDKNCQQQCSDCVHAPAVSVIPHTVYKFHEQRVHDFRSIIKRFPDNAITSLQFRPPRA